MNINAVDAFRIPIIDLIETGKNIKRIRETSGISVRELQAILGFTNPQAIYKWQSGECLPSIDNLVILAAVLGVSVDDILVIEDGTPSGGRNPLKSSVIECLSVQW